MFTRYLKFSEPSFETRNAHFEKSDEEGKHLSLSREQLLTIAESAKTRCRRAVHAAKQLLNSCAFHTCSVNGVIVRYRSHIFGVIAAIFSCCTIKHAHQIILAETMLIKLGQVVMQFRLRHAQ